MVRLSLLLVIMLLLFTTTATAYPWYSSHCVGCSGTYHQTYHPHTNYYYTSSYTYGYSGWGTHKATYNYRYPHYNYYHSHRSLYPYAYSFYPNPMYRSGQGWYGPGIMW